VPHIHEKYDFVVAFYIVHGDKVLLVNHPKYGMWLPPGGHIELDEDPEEALYREAKEETGLDIDLLSTETRKNFSDTKSIVAPSYIDVHEANPPHKHICLVYFVSSKSNKHVLSSEHTDMQWLGQEDLDKPEYDIKESVRFYSSEAIKLARKVS
jgi:8-oxo-dGTP pyrophosphatase MutT (NUDIX family)